MSMGLDLRALPRNAPTAAIDSFVKGEAWELAGTAPARVYTMSGVGAFDVAFDGSSRQDARARCNRAVTAYLPKAPKKAGSNETAARVVTACHDCPPEQR